MSVNESDVSTTTTESTPVTTDTTSTVTETQEIQSTDWKSYVTDEELKNDPTLSTIKDVESLAKGYASAQRMIGSRVPIPSEDASKEVKEEFYQKVTKMPGIVNIPAKDDKDYESKMGQVYEKLGRPKTPNDYKLEVDEQVTPLNQEFVKEIKDIAYKNGLNNAQLNALAKAEVERTKQVLEFLGQQKEATRSFLKKEWGETFDEKKELYRGVLNKYREKFPDAIREIEVGAAGNNPVIAMMAAELGAVYRENGTIASRAIGAGVTPEEAMSQINDIMSNKEHPYHNYNSPSHNDAVQKVNRLYQSAYPSNKE